jgi:hypothetical protein
MGEAGGTQADTTTMNANRTRIGDVFETNKADIPLANMAPGLTKLGADLSIAPPSATSDLQPVLKDILATITRNGGVLPADAYSRYVQSGGTLQKIASGSEQSAPYAQDILDLLHGGLKASVTKPQADAIDLARQQYRAWYAINDAARGSGDGSFNADQLHAATTAQSGRFGNTQGILDPYANAGKTILGTSATAPPTSGGAGVAAGAGAAAKFLAAISAKALAAAPPIAAANLGLQAVNRASGPRAIQTLQSGGGQPVNPYLLALQRALPALMAQSRPQNGQQ